MTDHLDVARGRLAAGEITPEEFDSLASRLQAQQTEQQQLREAYGNPAGGVGPGGGRTTTPDPNDDEAVKDRVLKRLRAGMGMQDSAGKMDFNRFATIRMKEGAHAAINSPSYRSWSRTHPDDLKVGDDRVGRRKQQGSSL